MKLIKVAQPIIGIEEVNAVKQVILSGKYISGAKVQKFEEKFANYLGVKYAVAVNSGTAALHVALSVLEIGYGNEVIVPPLTFFSTVSSILSLNAIPIFADIDPKTYCIDSEDVENKISERTKAVIPVHLYGNAADMERIMKVAKKFKLKVIEDAAQAHGTEYKGNKVGSIGDIGIFSFFATKHITTGEGGILVTNNKRYAEKAKLIRNHGMKDRDNHIYLGYNYRMTEMAAAMGIVQLTKLEGFNKKRIKNSLYLINELNKIKIPWLKTPQLEQHIKHTFFWCPVFIDEKKLGMNTKQLIKILLNKGIETRHRYWEPLYKQKVLRNRRKYQKRIPPKKNQNTKETNYKNIYLKNAERVAGKFIGLPNHVGLKKEDLDYIIDVVKGII